MKLSLTQVHTEADVEWVTELANEIWQEYYIEIITQEQIDYMLKKFQSVEAILKQIEEGFEYYLMVVNGVRIGYVSIKQEEHQLFLSKFYIQRDERGKGFASQAMAWLTDICKQRNLQYIWLTVNRHNELAKAVYEKKGFRLLRTEIADIGNGFVMDDWIMQKKID